MTRQQDSTSTAKPCAILANVVEGLQLRDAWIQLHPGEVGHLSYTFSSAKCKSRLDRFYLSRRASALLCDVDQHTLAVSDHRAVSMELAVDVEEPPRPPRQQWKLDPAVLVHPHLQEHLRAFWTDWQHKKSNFGDIVSWWEQGKVRLRSFLARFTRETRKQERAMLQFLQQCLDEAVNEGGQNSTDAVHYKELIIALLKRRLPLAAGRAKVDSVDGEVPSLHPVAAAIRRGHSNTIGSLEHADGTTVEEPARVLELVRAHLAATFAAPLEQRERRVYQSVITSEESETQPQEQEPRRGRHHCRALQEPMGCHRRGPADRLQPTTSWSGGQSPRATPPGSW